MKLSAKKTHCYFTPGLTERDSEWCALLLLNNHLTRPRENAGEGQWCFCHILPRFNGWQFRFLPIPNGFFFFTMTPGNLTVKFCSKTLQTTCCRELKRLAAHLGAEQAGRQHLRAYRLQNYSGWFENTKNDFPTFINYFSRLFLLSLY